MAVTAAMHERDVKVGPLDVHLYERGTGMPVLVLHHSNGLLWNPFLEELADSNHVLAPDMPGYGRSARPEKARSPRDLAVLLHQLLDVLDVEPVHLVGFGLGGWIAAEMATMGQRRLSTLTLVGAAGLRPRDGFIHDPVLEGHVEYARLGFHDEDRFRDVYGDEPEREVVYLWDLSREMTCRLTWKPWMWSISLPMLLAGVVTPTAVVWGDDDRIMPLDCGRQYAELLPNARLDVVRGTGHSVDLERPAELAALVAAHVDGES